MAPDADLTRDGVLSAILENRVPKTWAYHQDGVQLWKRASQHLHYYQTHEESEILEQQALEIAKMVQKDATLLDFGAGDTRKIEPLLLAIEKQGTNCTYVCLDVSEASINDEVLRLKSQLKHVNVIGLEGTFDVGSNRLESCSGQRIPIFLGSTALFLDFHFAENNPLLSLRPGDFGIIGQDCHEVEDIEKVAAAYHSKDFHAFIDNGLVAKLNKVLGGDCIERVGCRLQEFCDHSVHVFMLQTTKELRGSTCLVKSGTKFDGFRSYKPKGLSLLAKLRAARLVPHPLHPKGCRSCLFIVTPRPPQKL